MTEAETQAEIERLEKLRRARDGIIGYRANVAAIDARLAELKANDEPDLPDAG